MAKKRIIILGAGLAGLSAAWHLQRRGIDCQVFEREPEVGGLCRSRNVSGFTFDCDGHLLHFKHSYSFNFLKSLLGENLARHEREAWVYFQDRYIRYPFQANLSGLSPSVIKECLWGFKRASKSIRRKNNKKLNFSSWIKQTFGQGIARHFMAPYNSKFWTVPLHKLTCEWLDGFIPVPSLAQVIKGSREQATEQFGYNVNFWYPKKGGINQLPLALTSPLKHIYTNCPVTAIDLDKREIRIGSRNKENFDYLISTIPLPEIPYLTNCLPEDISRLFSRLNWNSIFNLNLGIEKKKDNASRHWVYFPERSLSFFRAGFPHNFSSSIAPEGASSLYIEVAYSRDRPIDKNRITQSIKEDLQKVGLLKKESSISCQDINDIKYGYPIYDLHYNAARAKIIKYLLAYGIIPCGRYGSWRYFSMEDAILDGRHAAGMF